MPQKQPTPPDEGGAGNITSLTGGDIPPTSKSSLHHQPCALARIAAARVSAPGWQSNVGAARDERVPPIIRRHWWRAEEEYQQDGESPRMEAA